MQPTVRILKPVPLPATLRALSAACGVLLLCSCAAVYEQPRHRAPVEEIGSTLPAEAGPPAPEAPAPAPLQREVLPPSAPPVLGPPAPALPRAPTTATGSLLEAVDAAMAAGELERAAALCERALRLTPRDAALWLKLALIRQRQGRADEARGFAQRALSLAAGAPQVELQARALLDLLDS